MNLFIGMHAFTAMTVGGITKPPAPPAPNNMSSQETGTRRGAAVRAEEIKKLSGMTPMIKSAGIAR